MVEEVQKKLRGEGSESDKLKVRLEQLQREIDKFVDLYRDGILDKDDLRRRTADLKEQKQAISNRLQEIIQKESATQIAREKIMAVILGLREELHLADPSTRKRVLHQMIDGYSTR